MAISNDGSTLVINNGTGEVEFFDLAWNETGDTPVITPRGYSFVSAARRNDGSSHNNYIYQMNFDFGGNLIVTGNKVAMYSIPTENNAHTTPAKSEYIVMTGEEPQGVPGDVNGDGYVSSADVTVLYNYLLNTDTEFMVNGDQDGDGFVTAADVTVVYNILLGSRKK